MATAVYVQLNAVVRNLALMLASNSASFTTANVEVELETADLDEDARVSALLRLDADSEIVRLLGQVDVRPIAIGDLTDEEVARLLTAPHEVLMYFDAAAARLRAAAERIFERFYRMDRGRTRSQGGVGLGLAIVRAVVDAHGGSVAYRPRQGGGSVFRVVLPLAAVAAAKARTDGAATG